METEQRVQELVAQRMALQVKGGGQEGGGLTVVACHFCLAMSLDS